MLFTIGLTRLHSARYLLIFINIFHILCCVREMFTLCFFVINIISILNCIIFLYLLLLSCVRVCVCVYFISFIYDSILFYVFRSLFPPNRCIKTEIGLWLIFLDECDKNNRFFVVAHF